MKTKLIQVIHSMFLTLLFFLSYYGAYELGKLVGETQESLNNKQRDIVSNQKLQNCLQIIKERE